MTYRIFFKDILVETSIGIHEFERRARQRLLVNVEVFLDRSSPDDRIEAVADYDRVRALVMEVAASGHFDLQETFCERVLEGIAQSGAACAAVVSTAKPDVYADVAMVGCTAAWLRDGVDRAELALLRFP